MKSIQIMYIHFILIIRILIISCRDELVGVHEILKELHLRIVNTKDLKQIKLRDFWQLTIELLEFCEQISVIPK